MGFTAVYLETERLLRADNLPQSCRFRLDGVAGTRVCSLSVSR